VFGSLTAMRGVAALLVAFFHLRYGVMGVPLFDLYIVSVLGTAGTYGLIFSLSSAALFSLTAMAMTVTS